MKSIIEKYTIRLIAEEYPFDIHSPAFSVAVHRYIPYLQIDMFPDEQRRVGIFDELDKRPPYKEGVPFVCYRLSHADGVEIKILSRAELDEC